MSTAIVSHKTNLCETGRLLHVSWITLLQDDSYFPLDGQNFWHCVHGSPASFDRQRDFGTGRIYDETVLSGEEEFRDMPSSRTTKTTSTCSHFSNAFGGLNK